MMSTSKGCVTVELEQVLHDMLKTLTEKVDDIQERLTRLEERTSRKAGLYGLIGGLVPAVGFFIYWVMSR